MGFILGLLIIVPVLMIKRLVVTYDVRLSLLCFIYLKFYYFILKKYIDKF